MGRADRPALGVRWVPSGQHDLPGFFDIIFRGEVIVKLICKSCEPCDCFYLGFIVGGFGDWGNGNIFVDNGRRG